MKKIVLVFLVWFSLIHPVYAENETYDVILLSDDSFVASFSTFEDAYEYMTSQDHTGIMYQNQLIAMDEGVVVLDHGNCSVNIDTIYQKTDQKGYVNGCYGNDGLYLKTNVTGEWILMLQSGARVWVHRDDVSLVPYQNELLLSSYFVQDGHLYHQIRTRWNTAEYGSLIDLGPAPKQLNEDIVYLSYDGHSFYDDFFLMSEDMKCEVDTHAVNAQAPYYNYFMMLPHRSMSTVSFQEVESLFQSMHIDSKPEVYLDQNKDSVNDIMTRSQYIDSLDSFFYTQSEYGSNALLMLALSMNESASGRSSLAYRRNNLFGHAAYDSDVEKNAKRYFSVESSVISHAKNYISLSYANPEKFTYHGSFFGDKSCGMNVAYASDPYWSEKAAQYAYELDELLGLKDYNHEALAIVKDEAHLVLYDETLENQVTTVENQTVMSFVILDELDEYFLVQMDEIIKGFDGQNGSYDFKTNTGYLKKSLVDIVLNPENIHHKNYDTVVFKALTGAFMDGTDTKVLQFEQGSEVLCETPVKANAIFVSWKQVSENLYEAQYRDIDHIEMFQMPPQTVELNEHLDLSNGSIRVVYRDGQDEIIPLSTSMVSGYTLSEAKEQLVTVTYGGSSCTYSLTVSQHLDTVRNEINAMIETILDFDFQIERSEEELQLLLNLKSLMQEEFYPVLTMNQITQLERIYNAAFADVWSVILKENSFDLKMTGLHLSKDYGSAFHRFLFNDTLHVEIEETESTLLLKETAVSQGWTIEQGFLLSLTVNRQEESWEGPVLFSIKRPDDEMKTYALLFLSADDVIQCHTAVYEDCIRFKAFHPGEYLLVSKPSVNPYDTLAPEEVTLSRDNGMDIDFFIKAGSAIAVILLVFLIGVVLNLKRKKYRS